MVGSNSLAKTDSSIIGRLKALKGEGFEDDLLEDFFSFALQGGTIDFLRRRGQSSTSFLKRHQNQFMMLALNKIPDDVDVFRIIPKGHQRLFQKGLYERHFGTHLTETLLCDGIEQSLIDDVLSNVRRVREVFELSSLKKF